MADRATEARQRAEAVAAEGVPSFSLPDRKAMADDVLWLLDELDRLTEALRQTAVDLAITLSMRHGVPGGCGAIRPKPCQDCAHDNLALNRIGAALAGGRDEQEPAA